MAPEHANPHQIRALFSRAMSAMYREEVPAYGTLMELVRETGMGALIATHNLELAARMDRTVRLEEGRIV